MRAIVLVVVAIQIGLAHPACAENPTDGDRSLSELLPLFDKNNCKEVRDAAGQLFCGDPELSAASARLNSAVQDRMSRLPDRRLAVEENAEWIRLRNSSCGVFMEQSVRAQAIQSAKACLLKETEERIEILNDPNFDCLATNTTAGLVICSEPALAMADTELNGLVVELIAKLKEDEARDAFAEYARWTRARDRKCDLDDKDNVPLQELSSSAGCLAEYISQKTAEITAAKGDPKRVFGRHVSSALPDADGVDLCVAQIHSANACHDFLRVNRVFEIDSEVAEQSALVTAEVEMIVLSPFALCSPIASSCTGMCWDLKEGEAKPSWVTREGFAIARKLRIEKAFAFQKTDSGWRCNTPALRPVDFGVAVSGP
jgi:uncharacterized protein YecT (DUF1311 family)